MRKASMRLNKAKEDGIRVRRRFPYTRVAEMWAKGKTLTQIAKAIGRFNAKSDDPCHALRVVLTRMHAGYRDKLGNVVKLPYRTLDIR